MKNNSIAIIPARGGSKRIPKKNIKLFNGKPIIQYSIEAAIESGCFKEVMVSTDDEKIAQISRSCGAKVPFFRSKRNSDDHSGLAEVLEEVILEYKKREQEFDLICCILPTAPFISADQIQEALKLLKRSKADTVMPMVSFGYPVQRALRIKSGLVSMLYPENYNIRSQDLEKAYHDAGLFYWIRTEALFQKMRIFTDNTAGLLVPRFHAQDIDTIEDWEIAEMKYSAIHKKNQ